MIVEGVCAEGHELLCVVQNGHLTGVFVHGGSMRGTCPVCGAKPYLAVESGMHPASTKIASTPPQALTSDGGRKG
jgi:hypothetical protein